MLTHRLAPFDFRGDFAARRPGCYRGLLDPATAVLSFPEFAELIRHHLLERTRVRVLRSGDLVPQEAYSSSQERLGYSYAVPRPSAVNELLADGATLVFNGLDEVHDGAADGARDLEAALGCPVRANVYASFSETPGFAMHWDDHDVVVTQLQGVKRWTYGPPSVPDPLPGAPGAYRKPAQSELRTVDLEAGDGLYLPRGWWHMAQASSGPSLHITWSISRPTGVQLISWLALEAVGHPEARADLALDRDSLPAMRAAVEAVMSAPDLVERFRRHVAALTPDRSVVRFPL